MQIKGTGINYTYMKETPFEKKALNNISLSIKQNRFIAIIGHTGSGKSTFIQLLNGLLKPTEGELVVDDWKITNQSKQKELYFLRKKVGMVFQYPEHQLFHETVLQDVAYGPLNFNIPKADAIKKAKEMLQLVGIGEELYDRSPFDLSGGQMRRVAIAGVLALEPKLLVLDEPTAGLDPSGQEEMLGLFYEWYKREKDRSVVLVTHQMEDAAKYADDILVLAAGELVAQDSPAQVFKKSEQLKEIGLGLPATVQLLQSLKEKSGQPIETTKFTIEDTVDEVLSFLRKE